MGAQEGQWCCPQPQVWPSWSVDSGLGGFRQVPQTQHPHGARLSSQSNSPISSLVQVTPVPELSLTAVKLSHDGTGAQYLHLAREDRNNLFRCVCILGSWSGCPAGAPAAVQQEWRGGESPPRPSSLRSGGVSAGPHPEGL